MWHVNTVGIYPAFGPKATYGHGGHILYLLAKMSDSFQFAKIYDTSSYCHYSPMMMDLMNSQNVASVKDMDLKWTIFPTKTGL